ncbi:hypothetical protein ACJX0J_008678, partial [Zea mays]
GFSLNSILDNSMFGRQRIAHTTLVWDYLASRFSKTPQKCVNNIIGGAWNIIWTHV